MDLEAHLHYKMHFLHKDLTQEDKELIKNKIRAQERKLNIKVAIISAIVFIGLALLMHYLITQIMSN